MGIRFDINGAVADVSGTATPEYFDANGNVLSDLGDSVKTVGGDVSYTMQILKVKEVPLDFDVSGEVADGYLSLIHILEEELGIPVIPISAAKNEGIGELIDHALHVTHFQEKPGRQDFCDADYHGGAVHRCLHGIMHLIEDHAQNAGIPVRFAASKLAEGDEEIEARLNLDTNEKETLEHIICQMRCV